MSRRIPVLLIESGHGWGGTERVVDALARGLDREQFQPWLVLSDDPSLDAWADDARRDGIPVERRAEITSRFQGGRMVGWLRFLRRHRHALVHVHHVWPSADRYLVPVARLSGVAAVVVTDHLAAPPHSSWQRHLKAWESRHVDAHVAVSQAVAATLAGEYGLSPESLEVVENGVALPPELAPAERERLRNTFGASGRRVWLGVGRLERQKGFDLLLDAWKELELPRPLLVILGDGSERRALEDRTSALQLGGDVHFAGAWRSAARAYGAADAVILPSRFEGMPLALLEALCAGIPVVATAVGGVPEATENGRRARLVPPEEVHRLAEAVREIEADPEASRRRAALDASWARRRFRLARMVEDYERIYRRALRHSDSAVARRPDRPVAA